MRDRIIDSLETGPGDGCCPLATIPMSATALTVRVVSFSFMAAAAGKILGLFVFRSEF